MLSSILHLPQTSDTWHCLGLMPPMDNEVAMLIFHQGNAPKGVVFAKVNPEDFAAGLRASFLNPPFGEAARPQRIVADCEHVGNFLRPLLASANIEVGHGRYQVPDAIAHMRRDLYLKTMVDSTIDPRFPGDVRFRFWDALRHLTGTWDWRQTERKSTLRFTTSDGTGCEVRMKLQDGEAGFTVCALGGKGLKVHVYLTWDFYLGLLRLWPVVGDRHQSELTMPEIEMACLGTEALLAYVEQRFSAFDTVLLRRFIPQPLAGQLEFVPDTIQAARKPVKVRPSVPRRRVA